MSPREQFNSFSPESIYLDLHHPQELADLLHQNGWISTADKTITLEKPGEGNMNFVVRVKTDSGSIIAKQSRPWVEKYPQISAPMERILVEAEFYKTLNTDPFYRNFTPAIIGFDAKNFLLALEDLGSSSDCTFLYQRTADLEAHEMEGLVNFISHLHNHPWRHKKTFPDNAELKKLNHTHIFYYPFLEDNGFSLDTIQPGLQAVSMKYKTNILLKQNLKTLGDIYLQNGETLIHGDYYPGSWLKTDQGIRIIDPEFSHYGYAEFDLGIMVAHLKMSHAKDETIRHVIRKYIMPDGFSMALFLQFCGVEIMRRIIGLAQLPLDLTVAEKSEVLDFAERLIQHPEDQNYF
jgi:5-methylthioribose kinase